MSTSSLRRRRPLATEDNGDNENTDEDFVDHGQEEIVSLTSLLGEVDPASPSLTDIDRSMRHASVLTLSIWILLVVFAYKSVPETSLEKLQGAEQMSALFAFVVMTGNILVQLGPQLLRKIVPLPGGGGIFFDAPQSHFSGILLGGMTTQIVAAITNALMAFCRVPILIDPILNKRVSVLRWAEFSALGFLITFLTEAFGVRDARKEALSIPWLHASCQGLATLCGMLFPYCSSKKSWYTLLFFAVFLFSVIFPRVMQKEKEFRRMKLGRTVDEAILYDRARLSLRMIHSCSICWTMFPVMFFLSGYILPAISPPSSPFRNPALPMIFEALMDIFSKMVQMNVIIDVHEGVFDDRDGTRALQRLEEVKIAIGEKWDTAQDVVIISLRQEFSGAVMSMVNSSIALFPRKKPDTQEKSFVFSLRSQDVSSLTHDFDKTDFSIQPTIVSGTTGAHMQRLSDMAGLIVRAWNTSASPHANLSHDVGNVVCDAEITKLEENLRVVVVRGAVANNN
jgi:hypothetical protein